MTTSRRTRALLLAATATAGALSAVVAGGTPASAASIYCDTTREHRQAVLLVHGYNSGPDTWSDATRSYLARSASSTCVDVFDYKAYNDRWATDPHLGPALAARIDTLATASKTAGGAGKIIVVAHSNGGLITRCAAAPSCNGGRKDVANRLLELISFDTPNTGSFIVDGATKGLGNLLSATCTLSGNYWNPICKEVRTLGTSDATRGFTPGSAELAALAPLPASVPVYGLAGHVELHSSFFGLNDVDLGTGGDLIVRDDSAIAAARQIGQLGGAQVIDCGTLDLTDLFAGGHSCWHGTETNDTRFLQAAAHQIGLAEQLYPPPGLVTATSLQDLESAQVPANCRLPAQRLVHGHTTRGSPGGGSISTSRATLGFADFANLGYAQALTEYDCSAGGVGWPQELILIGSGGTLLGYYDLGQHDQQEHSNVSSLSVTGNSADIRWDSYEGAGSFFVHHQARVAYTSGRLVLTGIVNDYTAIAVAEAIVTAQSENKRSYLKDPNVIGDSMWSELTGTYGGYTFVVDGFSDCPTTGDTAICPLTYFTGTSGELTGTITLTRTRGTAYGWRATSLRL